MKHWNSDHNKRFTALSVTTLSGLRCTLIYVLTTNCPIDSQVEKHCFKIYLNFSLKLNERFRKMFQTTSYATKLSRCLCLTFFVRRGGLFPVELFLKECNVWSEIYSYLNTTYVDWDKLRGKTFFHSFLFFNRDARRETRCKFDFRTKKPFSFTWLFVWVTCFKWKKIYLNYFFVSFLLATLNL